jgi:hypothetical protein
MWNGSRSQRRLDTLHLGCILFAHTDETSERFCTQATLWTAEAGGVSRPSDRTSVLARPEILLFLLSSCSCCWN